MATILDNAQLPNYMQKRYKEYTNEHAFLRLLEGAGRVMKGVKGTDIRHTIYTANDSQFRTVGIGAVLPRSEQLNEVVATYDWAAYHAHRPFDGLVRSRMGGKWQIIDAVSSLVEKLSYDAEESFASQLIVGDGAALSGGSGQSIIGLDNILTSSDTTYAGIAQASNTFWRPQRLDVTSTIGGAWDASGASNGITALLKAKMDTRRSNPNGISRDAEVVMIDRTNLYALFRQAEERNTVIEKVVGHEYEFWGFKLVMDDFMSASAVYLLNLDTFELVTTEKQLFNLVETEQKNAIPGTVVYDLFMQVALKCLSMRHNAILYNL